MRIVIAGFDITAWLAAATSILRGHEVTLLATRGSDTLVVSAAQHPGQWLLCKTGDAARILDEIDPDLAQGDYKTPVGIHTDGKLVALKDWLCGDNNDVALNLLNLKHAARTGRTVVSHDAHFGVVERAIVSKSYVRHMSQDDAAAALVRFVRTRATVIPVTQWVVNNQDVWYMSNGSGDDVEFDLLVLADRAHTTEFGNDESWYGSKKQRHQRKYDPVGYVEAKPLQCHKYEAIDMGLAPFLSVVSTDTSKIAIITSNGDNYQIWTYGDEDRDAVRRDVADGFGDPNMTIIAAERMFGGYEAEPLWHLPSNIIAIGWQARGEVHSVDDAMRELNDHLHFIYQPLDDTETLDEDDDDLIINEPGDDDDD